ncbi:FAD/FMN-containing dehydrogenase [Apibacter mensalis]|uniref:FAD/FMN-containing dehydrogenase n=1 Tax=Apibacter mensalis TaxID=1586267 RepID=A0A0X3ANQ8_9FLAO|nr:FAD-binding oxidoreductase [Apibacter mensalis]CVK15873.1 FAD/FMN-containing dehydrogenase [Apibacter mensalis]
MNDTENKKNVTNWGKYPVVKTNFHVTSDLKEIEKIIKKSNSIIARGNGRSYGDNSLNSDNILSTLRLNKFLSFDREKGVFECESGVILSDILDVIVPEGYFLPVTPGTKLITVGGAIGANVHGKNNHSEGCFGDYLVNFNIITQDGEIKKCSREENSDLFWNTIGGMGLTGVIISAKFTLKRIQTAYIKQKVLKAENLEEIFKFFEECENWTYSVAWIDCLQKGKRMGRSILMVGEHATLSELPTQWKGKPLQPKKKFKLNVPFDFPSFILNTWSVKAFNFLYYFKQRKKIVSNIVDYDTFFYPLDAINNWNRIYGRNGFIQYQFIIPKKVGKEGMTEILKTIAKSGQGSFLAVLKLYKKGDLKAHNSFPIDGYSLALDFKINKKLSFLVKELDEIVEHYGGRIYLAKDSMSKKTLIDYVKVPETGKFDSLQQKRIDNYLS